MSEAKVIPAELEQVPCLSIPRSRYGAEKTGCGDAALLYNRDWAMGLWS